MGTWKGFYKIYWACALLIPVLILITQGWKAVISPDVMPWYYLSVGVFIVARIAEWISNREIKK